MTEHKSNVTLSGLGVSSGLAVGQAFVYRDILYDLERYDIGTHQVESEHARIGRAVRKCSPIWGCGGRQWKSTRIWRSSSAHERCCVT